jgi:hypothetical protein
MHKTHDCDTLITLTHKAESDDSMSMQPGLILLYVILLFFHRLLSFRDLDRHYDSTTDLVHQHLSDRKEGGDSHSQHRRGSERRSIPLASTCDK